MEFIKYVILGIIQWITEPLPISSSGHLLIIRELFNNMSTDLNFEIIVNFGSLLAIFLIFWKDIVRLVTNFFKYIFTKGKEKEKYFHDFKYCLLIVIGSIPVGIMGLLFKDQVEAAASVRKVGIALYITAIALFIVRNAKGTKKDQDITYKDAILIGLFQTIALFPGLSRSGMTLVGCLLCGLSRDTSLRYTFMLYFPVSIASFGLSIFDIAQTGMDSSLVLSYGFAAIMAFIFTYLTYGWLSNMVKNGKLWKFSIYCIIVATFVLIYFR